MIAVDYLYILPRSFVFSFSFSASSCVAELAPGIVDTITVLSLTSKVKH